MSYGKAFRLTPDAGGECLGFSRKPRSLQAESSENKFIKLEHVPHVSGTVENSQRADLTLTIFCAPKPFIGEEGDAQKRALRSWLYLDPPPKVVLLGNDPTFESIAREFPGYVVVEPELDTNFRGLPLFNSMVARARVAETKISLLINADIMLLDNLYIALGRVSRSFEDWMLTGMRWDMVDFPFVFPANRGGHITDLQGNKVSMEVVDNFVQGNGTLHTYGGVDFWAWNNRDGLPLHSVPMPPFANGRGRFDNWFTHEVIHSGLRAVIDGSDAVTTIHVKHSYRFVADGKSAAKENNAGLNFWTQNKGKSWEAYLNVHLSQQIGTNFTNQLGTANHIPWKLSVCHDPEKHNLCLLKRKRPGVCQCEHSAFVNKAQTDPHLLADNRTWQCGMTSIDKSYVIDPIPKSGSPPGLPHTQKDLLEQVADQNKVVVLVGANYGYREVLMNFVCQLKSFGLSNLLVAALDEDLYQFAFTQGLPVYYELGAAALANATVGSDCAFGSNCFRNYTKLKSRAVLQVLKAGYHVLWTDIDIVWLSNPLPSLMAYGSNVLPIQTNEPNITLPANGFRRINSGFYLARSEPSTINAFTKIVDHASKTTLSEQPSFYDVLCATGAGSRSGDNECLYEGGLKVVMLDRLKYPNGAVNALWNATDVVAACRAQGAIILHNNWISGIVQKKERLVKNGMWRYDERARMCMHSWHPNASSFKLAFHGN